MPYAARTPAFNSHGTIDLEVEHPSFGWLPFTADPNDSEEAGRELHALALTETFGPVAPYVAPPVPDPPTTVELEAEVQAITDALTVSDERMMALAMATVDLRMADITGLTTQQVRQAFRDRVVFYLRQRRGL